MEMNVLEMHGMLAIGMVDKRRVIQPLSLVKKNVLADTIPLVEHERQTRHNEGLKIKLPIPKNEHVRQAPYYTGCKLWNNLPLHVRDLELTAFKKEIKNMVKNNLILLNLQN